MINPSGIKLSTKDMEKDLILPTQLTPDLAYLCGLLSGDGFISMNRDSKDFYIKCVGNPQDEIDFYNDVVCKLFKKVFNLDIKAKYHDKNTTYGITVYSKALVEFLVKIIGLHFDKKSDKISIPKIFKSDRELVRYFIQGFADADFSLALKKRYKQKKYYPAILGASKSRQIIEDIAKFLNNLEFKVIVYERIDFDSRVNKNIRVQRLDINGHKQLVKWMQTIGFRNPKNIKKFELWKKRNQNNPWAVDALNLLSQ